MHHQILLCFLLSLIGRPGVAAAAADPNYISINCGGAAPATARNGRKWGVDSATEGSSTSAATVEKELIESVDPVPYFTARISLSQFSYSFNTTPGQKSIRLHFNPVSYHGFESFNDFFTVESGPFTLLANFSASTTARALSLNVIVKEFCINVKENETLNLVFYPETRRWENSYAFINGIDIISLPSIVSDIGVPVPVLGHKSMIYVDNSTALERILYQDIKWRALSSSDDIGSMFGMWAESSLKKHTKMADNKNWSISVDVGFMYLVRLHLCEVKFETDFVLLINDMVSLTSIDMLRQRGNRNFFWYDNYMVIPEVLNQEDKHDILISLHSHHEFLDRHGPLEGFEVFKLSNHDRTLASPSILFPGQNSPSRSRHTLLYHLLYNLCCCFFLAGCFLALKVMEHKMSIDNFTEKDNKPFCQKKQLYRRFSLAEIQAATEKFNNRFVLRNDEFGKVVQGFIDKWSEIADIERIKPDLKQEEHEFLTEIETPSELQHVNLVDCREQKEMGLDNDYSTIERLKPDLKQEEHEFLTEIETTSELQHVNLVDCREQKEMVLDNEYITIETLADLIYELKKNNDFDPLSWKQRLEICIGVGRSLDYLHMGHRIIYRDFKASNVLIGEKFVPKVTDFGLVKIGSDGESLSQGSKYFRGTFGYMDLKYFKTREPTEKSHVYSFGVLLLEVLCGRPAPPWNEQDKGSLITWKGQVAQLVAPSLRGKISPDSLKIYMEAAEGSLHDIPEKRPNMADIVATLELALLQQEKGESVAPNERIRAKDVFSCHDKSGEENMNFIEPNVKLKVDNGVSPSLPELVDRKPFRTDFYDILHNEWVREFENMHSERMQDFTEFQSEFLVGRFSHDPLSGYCREDGLRALLYETMTKFCMEKQLTLGRSLQPLLWEWETGLKIAIEMCSGRALLRASNTGVIYGDLKHTNKLPDMTFNAKLSNFGRTRFIKARTLGTHWCAAPECIARGQLHFMSDYGIDELIQEIWAEARIPEMWAEALDRRHPPGQYNLLDEWATAGFSRFKIDGHRISGQMPEMFAWKQALDPTPPPGQHSLVEWMKPYLCKRWKLNFIDDLELEGKHPSISALLLALLGFDCLEGKPEPKEIVDTLDTIPSSNERPEVYFGD